MNVRYYSAPDSGVIDRVCAPLDYGPGPEGADGIHRYWLWEYSSTSDPRTVGLVPKQIVELRVLGETFDPAELGSGAWPWAIVRAPHAAV